jgi:hypothetical protein
MGACRHDRDVARVTRPRFKALIVGLHWPSLPWGDERIPGAGGQVLGVDGDTTSPIEDEIAQYAASIADTPVAREAIRAILEEQRRPDTPGASLRPEIRAAYETLYAEAHLAPGDVEAAPGADHEQWDPNGIYREAREATDQGAGAGPQPALLGIGDGIRDALVAPLRQLSFWKMKDRARRFGESGAHALLRDLQAASREETRFHLMGHSFGCIVVSATIAGPPGGPGPHRPVDSLFLVQGALSLWAYAPSIDYVGGRPGYFHRIVSDHLVRGPIVTTRSTKDTAVGRLYPRAAGLAGQVVLGAADYPKYGGVGVFGIQGMGAAATDLPMQSADWKYEFAEGRIYNLEASEVIKEGGGFSGAHSDIAHPEVAHVMWQAVLSR